ncbi:hypothetical protein CDD81_479 [Ophiocordyceps australis]|uniref:Uncharacterized protein n=1 Tax=Ophiocordyceps australis TaxID=1399860 RepID=A0A2C5XVP3_9HYPO|nr:hypothetical protein CDD81_479 [Ophiocordyceps australis]
MVHSVVEYIPGIGTGYSVGRTITAALESNSRLFWASVADSVQASIRDVIIVTETIEPLEAVILHSMTESFTEKLIDIHHSRYHRIHAEAKVDRPQHNYVIVAENSQGKRENEFFNGTAKGVYYFFNSTFSGSFEDPIWAPNGEEIQLHLERGFYKGAPIMFTWKRARNSSPEQKRAVA